MTGRALKMAFWLFHDHIGALLGANLIWAVSTALPLAVAFPMLRSDDPRVFLLFGGSALFVALFIVSPIMCTGIAQMVKTFIDTRDGGLSDFFSGVKKFGARAAATGILYGIAMSSFLSSAWFYASRLQGTAPLLGYVIGGLTIGCALVLCFMGLLMPAAIVQRKAGVFQTFRLLLLIVAANPVLMIALALQSLFITILSLLFLPLLSLGYASAIVCISSAAYELLARKYAPEEEPNEDYLNRGVRDLFFPWKS